jgi:hypothetical protein
MSKVARTLLILSLSSFATHAVAESLWTCETSFKGRNVFPPKNKISFHQSAEIRFFDDGSALADNHITQPVPGIYYTKGKKVWFYPNRDAVTQGIYDETPGVSNVQILSNYLAFKFKGAIDQAQTAKVRGHVDEQFVAATGGYVRVVGNGKGACQRIY